MATISGQSTCYSLITIIVIKCWICFEIKTKKTVFTKPRQTKTVACLSVRQSITQSKWLKLRLPIFTIL